MRANNLLILGAGQYGCVVKEIAEDSGAFGEIACLDDKNSLAIGKFTDIEKFKGRFENAVVAIGNIALREKLINELKAAGYKLPAIVSPKAYVSKSAKIGYNTIIEPFAIVNTKCEIGNGTFICAGAIVNHNAKIGENCTLQCGSVVPANSNVAAKTTLDYNKVYDVRFLKPIEKRTPIGNDYKFEDGI